MKTTFTAVHNSQSQELIVPILQETLQEPLFKNFVATYQIADTQLGDIKGSYKSISSCYPNHSNVKKIHFIGLGTGMSFMKNREAIRSFSFKRRTDFTETVGVFTSFLPEAKQIEAVINGLELSTYNVNLYKTKTKKAEHLFLAHSIEIISDREDIDKIVTKAIATGETQKEVMHLIDQPASHMYPLVLADWVLDSSQKYGYEVTILDKSDIKKEGLEALLAVNRGSELPPKFIIAEHKPKGYKDFIKIGLVGKGVTYDTGGLNIKVNGMRFMKSDMGGAAMMLGAMELTAKLNLPIHLITIVGATDNRVGSTAISPGDVINSYSGKTIEVIDTDAEGRLTLADGLNYLIRNYNPTVIIDAATLTGSSVRTLGFHAGALFSNNQNLANQLYRISEQTGERLWQLPLYEEFQNELKSDIADIANLGSRPTAGASTAAKFLEYFIEEHKNWAHIDMAGVAYGDSEYASHKSGTGYGVNLMVEYFLDLIEASK